MARKTKSPLALQQTDDVWYCAVRKLRTFVREDEGGEAYFRPSVIMAVSMKTDLILTVEIHCICAPQLLAQNPRRSRLVAAEL